MDDHSTPTDGIFSSTNTRILLPFAAIGAFWLATHILNFVRLLFNLFILPGKPLRSFGPPGSWALVTGASDGIGLEFASQLAAQKFNVLLVSRTASKLSALASSLSQKHNVQTKTVAMDFAHPTAQDWAVLSAAIDSLPSAEGGISILINNVGLSHDIPVPFVETPAEEMESIIRINCLATLKTTALVLPGMLARRRGLVLTMGSFGGLVPTPLLATYSGSKAFLQQWSSALGAEVADRGVRVELVQSYLVASAMSKIRRTSLLVPSPRAFVRAALSRVGREGGAQGFAHSSTPYWSHALMQWGLGATVGFGGAFVVDQSLAMHQDIRRRALRKREREAGAGKKAE